MFTQSKQFFRVCCRFNPNKSYKINYVMPILNQQQFLAEQFHAKDILLIKANYEAMLKIKRWKFIHSLSTLSKNIRMEADTMIISSFFTFIDNHEVLIAEGYFESELQN